MRTIPFGRPVVGDEEKRAVLEVLDGAVLAHGPRAAALESDFAAFTGSPHAVSVSSCTAAMHLIYLSLGLSPGDEVIVPAQTHVATAHAVELTGARPVFVDAEPIGGNIDVEQIEAAVTARTRAVAVVHFLGQPVPMPAVAAIAARHDLFVLEDCALAIGTRLEGVHAGLHGDAGCFSFYPIKHMTTAEGGMVITRDAELAGKVTRQRSFGVDRGPAERSFPGLYDVTMLGDNYRLNEMQAALGLEQIKRVKGFLEQRERNWKCLRDGLAEVEGITILAASEGAAQSSYYCMGVVLEPRLRHSRAAIVGHLKRQGIGTSVYYPHPVPLMSYYRRKYDHQEGSFPVASWISDCSIALPVGPHLDEDDMAYVADHLGRALAEREAS
jgi:dTDP-4-amino-4,6-dideoxygalactose transaminase